MTQENTTLLPLVNTEAKIPKKVLEALTLHECFCTFSNIKFVTEDSVRNYLETKFGKSISDKFKPEFLLTSQVS
jgi:hypothetical protein